MTKRTGMYLVAAGVGIVVVDKVTGKSDATKALFTGTNGVLTPINAKLPVSVQTLLILGGAVIWFMNR